MSLTPTRVELNLWWAKVGPLTLVPPILPWGVCEMDTIVETAKEDAYKRKYNDFWARNKDEFMEAAKELGTSPFTIANEVWGDIRW